MGLGDNRRSPKMRRRIRQRKLHERIARRRAKAAEERASTQTGKAAATAKPSKKK